MITKSCFFIHNNPYEQAIFTRAMNDRIPEAICFIAPTGIDAINIMLEAQIIPDYIFIELSLPRMGAMEFLKEIKERESLKEIPVVVHSVSAKPEDVVKLKELGARAIYFRPYEYYGICTLLTVCCGREMVGIQPN